VLVVDGHIAGVWALERRGGSVRIEMEAFAPLPKAIRAAAEAHARAYEALLGSPVEVAWVDRLGPPT